MLEYSSFIPRLQAIRRQMEELAQQEAALKAPVMTDLDDMELVYSLYTDLVQGEAASSRADRTEQKRKFLFIAVSLFAPASLAGDRLPRGLRERIAGVLEVVPSFVSDNLGIVAFQYQKFNAYREEVQYLCTEIENELTIRGKL